MLKKALLVIDFIKGIATGSGSCANYLKEHPEVIKNTNALIDAVRNNKHPIFHIRLAFDSNYNGLPKHAPTKNTLKDNHLFQQNSEMSTFIPEINKLDTDTVINKTYGDVFQGNNLIQQLKNNNIEEVILTGISTDNAIINSANTAMLNDFYVTVVEDASGAPTTLAHQNALDIMKGRTASEIITTSDLVKKIV